MMTYLWTWPLRVMKVVCPPLGLQAPSCWWTLSSILSPSSPPKSSAHCTQMYVLAEQSLQVPKGRNSCIERQFGRGCVSAAWLRLEFGHLACVLPLEAS